MTAIRKIRRLFYLLAAVLSDASEPSGRKGSSYESEENIKKYSAENIWNEYCGFLDLSMDEYMNIQTRLMEEQIFMWENCELGKKLLNGKRPHSIEEFREMVPLTTYEDYADVLLQKRGDMLPDTPIIWIQTTWEGGRHPVKVAPYTQGYAQYI